MPGINVNFGVSGHVEAAHELEKIGEQCAGLKEQFLGLGGAITTALAGFSLTKAAEDAMEFAESMGLLSQRAGLNVEVMTQWSRAANLAHVDAGILNIAFRDMQIWLAKTGQPFADVNAAMLKLSQRMHDLPDGALKTELAMSRLARAGSAMIPLLNMGPERLHEIFAESSKIGDVTEDNARMAEQWREHILGLSESWKMFALEIDKSLVPGLTKTLNTLTEILHTAKDILAQNPGVGKAIGATAEVLTGGAMLGGGLWAGGKIRAAATMAGSALGTGALMGATTFALPTVAYAGFSAWDPNSKYRDIFSTPNNASLGLSSRNAVPELHANKIVTDQVVDSAASQNDLLKGLNLSAAAGEGTFLRYLGSDGSFGPSTTKTEAEAPTHYNPLADRMQIEFAKQRVAVDKEYNAALLEDARGRYEREQTDLWEYMDYRRGILEDNYHAESGLINVEMDQLEREIEAKKKELDLGDMTNAQAAAMDMQIELLWRRWNETANQGSIATAKYSADRIKMTNEEESSLLKLRDERAAFDKDLIEKNPYMLDAQKNEAMRAGGFELHKPSDYDMGAQFKVGVKGLLDEWGTLQKQISDGFKNTINNAISSTSQGITGLIMGTKTWAQALKEIGTSILSNIVESIITMGLKWIATQVMISVLGKSLMAGTVGASIAAAGITSATLSSLYAAPAALATIATLGTAADLAPGEIAAALLAVKGESAVASFASGGYTGAGGQYDVAGLVHRGEFVLSADATSRIGVPALEGLANGTGGTGAGVTVVVSYSDAQMKRVLESAMARGDIIQHVRENRNAIGVRS